MPITWRNVDGPSLEGVSKILDSAGTTMNAGFDKLNQVIKTREDTQAKNWEAEKANNTTAAIDKLMSTKTPAELEAMKASGELEQFAAQFGDQFDQAKLREATVKQLSDLRTADTEAYNYGNMQKERQYKPGLDAADVLIAKGDFAGAKAALDSADLGAGEAARYTALTAAQRTSAEQTRSDQLTEITHPNALSTAKAETAAIETNRQVATLEKEAALAAQAHRTRQDDYGVRLGQIGKDNGLPVDGQGRLDVALLDSKQLAFIKKTAPDLFKAYAAGDTAAADSFLKSVGSRYDPVVVEKSKDILRGQFNTNQAQTLVGRDAENVLIAKAKEAVVDDEARGMNSYVPGSKDALGVYDRIVAQIPDMIDRTSGVEQDEDIAPMRSFAYRVMTDGIMVGGKKVTPSEQDLREVIGAARGSWFTDAGRAKDAEKRLMSIMKKNGTLERIKQSEEVRMRDRKREVEQKLKEARTPATK